MSRSQSPPLRRLGDWASPALRVTSLLSLPRDCDLPWALAMLTISLLLCLLSAWAEPSPQEQAQAQGASEQQGLINYTLSGDRIIRDGATEKLFAENGSLSRDGLEIRASRLEFGLESGDVLATGQVRVSQDESLLTGDEAHYNLRKRTGRLSHATALARGIHFSGEEIEVDPKRIAISSGAFTTCDRQRPHYQIRARRLELLGGRRVYASGVSLWFRGKRLLTLPKINQPIPGRGQAPTAGLLPRSGWTRADGGFAGLRYSFPLAGMPGYVETRLTTRRGLRFLSGLRKDTKLGELALSANVKEDLTDLPISVDRIETGLRSITLDRLPELSLETRPRALGRYLSGSALLAAGRYRELPSGVTAGRLAGSARFATRPLRFGRLSLVQAVSLRRAFYTKGEAQTAVLSRTGLGIRFSPSVRMEIAWERRTSSGEAPFLFDQIEIPRGLTMDALVRLTHGWRVEMRAWHDAQTNEFRDMDVTVTRRAHCLEYSATWRKARGQFNFQVGLAPFR